jgi:hypothetical protein
MNRESVLALSGVDRTLREAQPDELTDVNGGWVVIVVWGPIFPLPWLPPLPPTKPGDPPPY